MSVRFGIIGLGNRGYKYALRTIQANPACTIEIVCDTQGKHFDKFPDAVHTCHVEEVLTNPKVDAVFIATPDATHAEIVIAAVKAKKHILCEKPLEVTQHKMQQIYEAVHATKQVFEVGYVLRYARLFQRVKQLLTAGTIGELVLVNATDHIPYGGYAYFHDWHRRRAESTSLLLQKGTHTLDLINWYAGSEPKQVMAVGGLATMGEAGARKKFGQPVTDTLTCSTCDIQSTCEESLQNLAREKQISWDENWPDSCVFNSEVDVDDHQIVVTTYENQVKATYQLCQFSGFYKREFQLFGTMGELHVDDVSNRISIYPRVHPEVITYQNNYEEKNMEPGDEEQLQDFLEAINSGRQPVSNLESSIQAGLLALAAQHSIDRGTIEAIADYAVN